MKKFLYLIAFAGCAAMLFTFCKNNAPKTEGTDPDTEAANKAAEEAESNGGDPAPVNMTDSLDVMNLYATVDNLIVKPLGLLRYPSDGISGDALEHEVVKAWPKLSILVKQSGNELNILDIFTAIVEVYPAPQLLEAWYAIDDNSPATSNCKYVCDEKNHFISGEWPDPEFGNNFYLKAWEMMEENKWMIGLVYNRLWDGDDGIGLYQNLMFWTYDSAHEHILRPVDTNECFLPEYTPQRGYPVFRPTNDNIDFKDGADPDLFWKWNGHWFESSAPRE